MGDGAGFVHIENEQFFTGYIYNFANNTWRSGPNGPPNHNAHLGQFRLSDGRYWMFSNWGKRGLTFDPAQMEFSPLDTGIASSDNIQGNDRGVCNIGWNAYVADATLIQGGSTSVIYACDIRTGTAQALDRRSGLAERHALLTSLSAAGRDWLCFSHTPAGLTSAEHGLFDSQVYDADSAQWLNLPRCPTDLLAGYADSNGYPVERSTRIVMPDGFVVVTWAEGWAPAVAGTVRAARLRITSTPVPPQVCADLPASLTLDEGTSDIITYHLRGDIPPGGVDVVVERLTGDGDVRVVDGVTQRVMSRAEYKTVRIVGLMDADNVDDQAVVRVRVVQAGSGADANARTIPVTVRDLYHEATHMPGDTNGDGVVNAADLDEVVRNFGRTAGGN